MEYGSLQQLAFIATRAYVPHAITQCYLPPGRRDIPAFTPAGYVKNLALSY